MPGRFVVEARNVRKPATHALVIGVGDYPHLLGGSGRLTPNNEGMTQLSSPPISARAVAKWIIERLDDPARPLADVSLLFADAATEVFEHPRTHASIKVARATADNLTAAIRAWKRRGTADPRGRLIFFFCGHGMGAGTDDLALLASDYGAVRDDDLDGAIDFGYFHQAMQDCPAEQIYFVDACRVSTATLFAASSKRGRTPISTNITKKGAAPPSPVFYSTLPGASSHSCPGKPSDFTKCLLRGLEGTAANDSNYGEWWVTTIALQQALQMYLRRLASSQGAQESTADSQYEIFFHKMQDGAKGAALIACDPSTVTADATVRCVSEDTEDVYVPLQEDGCAQDEWLIEVPPGPYQVFADLDDRHFALPMTTATIRPVFTRVKVIEP